MRRLLLSVGAALLTCLVLSQLLYGLGGMALRHSGLRFSRIARGDIHVDVLIVGNSRARDLIVGRSPAARPSVFNLAYNGLSRTETLEWLRLFFERGNSARTVVVEITALYADTVMCDGKPYWILYPSLRKIEAPLCRRDAVAARWLPLTQLDSEQFLRALYYLRRGDQDWGDGGTIPPDQCARVDAGGIRAFSRNARSLDQPLLRAQIAALHAWLAQHAPGTRLVFVLAPFLELPAARAGIAQMEQINREVLVHEEYLNLVGLLGADCSAFADDEHVGPGGRQRVAAALLGALASGEVNARGP